MSDTGFCAIPNWIMEDESIKPTAKLLYARISGLSHKYGFCYATNEYLCKGLGIKKDTVTKILKDLKSYGLLSCKLIRNDNNQVIKRELRILNGLPEPIPIPPRIDSSTPPRIDSGENIQVIKDNINKPPIVPQGDDKLLNDIDRCYEIYPTKCLTTGRSLGKSGSDKKKIKRILEKTEYPLYKAIWYYNTTSLHEKSYMKNFGTFLNNLPDISLVEASNFIDSEMDHERYVKSIKEAVRKLSEKSTDSTSDRKELFSKMMEEADEQERVS